MRIAVLKRVSLTHVSQPIEAFRITSLARPIRKRRGIRRSPNEVQLRLGMLKMHEGGYTIS